MASTAAGSLVLLNKALVIASSSWVRYSTWHLLLISNVTQTEGGTSYLAFLELRFHFCASLSPLCFSSLTSSAEGAGAFPMLRRPLIN